MTKGADWAEGSDPTIFPKTIQKICPVRNFSLHNARGKRWEWWRRIGLKLILVLWALVKGPYSTVCLPSSLSASLSVPLAYYKKCVPSATYFYFLGH